jgi:hypothetical protein
MQPEILLHLLLARWVLDQCPWGSAGVCVIGLTYFE